MKKETLAEGTKLINDKEFIDNIIDKIIAGGTPGKNHYRWISGIRITVTEKGYGDRTSFININELGIASEDHPLSDNNRVVLNYLVKSFHDQVLKLYILQAQQIEEQFEALRDNTDKTLYDEKD